MNKPKKENWGVEMDSDSTEQDTDDEKIYSIPTLPTQHPKEIQLPSMPQAFQNIGGKSMESALKKWIASYINVYSNQQIDQTTVGIVHSDYCVAPKLGRAKMLSKEGEMAFKNRTRGMYYSDKSDKSHSLYNILEAHRYISEMAKLNNEACIELLKRLLKGRAYEMLDNLLTTEKDIGRIYYYLQQSFQDKMSPVAAASALQEFIRSPNIEDLNEVFLAISQWSARLHAREPASVRQANIHATATVYARMYLENNYPRYAVMEVNNSHLDWIKRHEHDEEYNSFNTYWSLNEIADKRLAGMRPTHAVRKTITNARAVPGAGQKGYPSGNMFLSISTVHDKQWLCTKGSVSHHLLHYSHTLKSPTTSSTLRQRQT